MMMIFASILFILMLLLFNLLWPIVCWQVSIVQNRHALFKVFDNRQFAQMPKSNE